MIQANELRIGNRVLFRGELDTVWRVEDNNYYTEGYGHGVTNQDLEPIPLTEDWLFTFGLLRYTGWDDMKVWCIMDEDENRFELIETNQGYEAPSGKIIEHVHTLQNAYFFHTLTGEELTINK